MTRKTSLTIYWTLLVLSLGAIILRIWLEIQVLEYVTIAIFLTLMLFCAIQIIQMTDKGEVKKTLKRLLNNFLVFSVVFTAFSLISRDKPYGEMFAEITALSIFIAVISTWDRTLKLKRK